MTQLAPLWRASMQFAREQQRNASPSSILNPSCLRTYAPDCPIESYRSQVDRVAEPFLRLIVGKIRVLPRRRTFSFDPCAFHTREKSLTMFLRIHLPRSMVEKKILTGTAVSHPDPMAIGYIDRILRYEADSSPSRRIVELP